MDKDGEKLVAVIDGIAEGIEERLGEIAPKRLTLENLPIATQITYGLLDALSDLLRATSDTLRKELES